MCSECLRWIGKQSRQAVWRVLQCHGVEVESSYVLTSGRIPFDPSSRTDSVTTKSILVNPI